MSEGCVSGQTPGPGGGHPAPAWPHSASSGEPGATGRSWSDFGSIIESIRTRLLTLPESTEVLTGHGESTPIGAETPRLPEWIARGH
jgi:glyoxylase-like metal-dependent hydrolase (beta-lactamase superfamily II)